MIYAILLAAIAVLFLLSRKDSKQSGKEEERLNALEVENEAMASRPLTDLDFINKLQSLADNKRKNKPDS